MIGEHTRGRCAALSSIVALAACSAAPARTLDRAFVSEANTATIAVVDLDEGRVESRIEVGLLPHNLVLSPDARTLYAVLAGSQAIAVIDTATATLSRTFVTAPVPHTRDDGTVIQPHIDQAAFGHTTCYDCHRDGGAAPRYVGGRPFGLRLSADGTRLFVAHINTGELVVFDPESGARRGAVALAPVGDVKEPTAVDLLGDEALVGMRATQPSRVPGLVRRLDALTLAPRGDIPSGANPVEVRALPALGLALCTRFDSNLVSAVSAAGETATVTVAGGPLGLTPLPDGRVLVLGYYSSSISLLDMARATAQTFAPTRDGLPLDNPTHAAVGTDPDIAWVVQSGTDAHLVALDVAGRRVQRSVPVNGLSYDVAIVRGSQAGR